MDSIKDEIKLIENDIRDSLKACDKDFSIAVSECERAERALCAEQTEKLITFISTVPNGVFSMSEGLCGVVEYSRNLGILEIDASKNEGTLVFMARSPKASQIKASSEELDAYARLIGGRHICASSYPGWDGNAESPLCRLYSECYGELFGEACRATVIHARNPQERRAYLFESGFEITEETLIEDGKIYQIIVAEYTGRPTEATRLELFFGKINLQERTELLISAMRREADVISARLLGKSKAGLDGGEDAALLNEILEYMGE